MLYWSNNRYAATESRLRRVVVINKKLLGPEHSNYTNALSNYATFLMDTGRLRQAEFLYTRAITTLERILPADDPDLLAVRGNLAALLVKRNRTGSPEFFSSHAAPQPSLPTRPTAHRRSVSAVIADLLH